MSKKIGNWMIKDSLPEGGQAHTFLVVAAGTDDDTKYVLKRLKNLERIQRFRQEFTTISELEHPNIVRVVDYDLDCDKPYFVTEYCEGGALRPECLRGMTLLMRLNLFREICEGVAYAHAQRVTHRDLKPSNIFLRRDGEPVVGDFGLCFKDEQGDRFTSIDEVVGPQWYTAPELESGRNDVVSPVSDVYALGKLLYWMLATRIFARERYRDPGYDLLRDRPNLEMHLVYNELLDHMITAEPERRIKDGSHTVAAVQAVIERIVKHRHALDLVARPHCGTEGIQGVQIASFRVGSIVTWNDVDTAGARLLGFGVRGSTLAAWGVRTSAQGVEEPVVLDSADGQSWTVRAIQDPPGGPICKPQASEFSAISFDRLGCPVIALTEAGQDGQNTAFAVTVNRTGDLQKRAIASNVGRPRYVALTIGPSGQIAYYAGNSESARSQQVEAEIIVSNAEGTVRRPMPFRTNYPGPLQYDIYGVLHQAVVVENPEQNGIRELYYTSRNCSGEWSQEMVDSTAQLYAGAPMSAHISLAVKPNGVPTILGNTSSSANSQSLVLYDKVEGVWRRVEIDLKPNAEAMGFRQVDAGGPKQIIIDDENRAHIALMSGSSTYGWIHYFTCDLKWNLLERRFFPATKYFGIGVDGSGTVHIAMSGGCT